MAIKGVSYGKFTLRELDPDMNEFTENLAYVKKNLADVSSTDTTLANISSNLAQFAQGLVQMTNNQLKSATVSYDVEIDLS